METVQFESFGPVQKGLIYNAKSARKQAYAPYSKFLVGAAVLDKTDGVFTGCNVENAMYEVTHAEQAAIVTAVKIKSSKPTIEAIAVVLEAEKEEQHAMPCGYCRQWLREFGDENMVIYGAKLNADGDVWQVEVTTLGELLPFSSGPNNLNQ